MKTYTKVMLVIVVLFAVLGPLLIKGKDDKPIMNLSDWFPYGDVIMGKLREWQLSGGDLVGKLNLDLPGSNEADNQGEGGVDDSERQRVEVDNAPNRLSADSKKMYKWQDENGRWHFSSDKPADLQSVSLEDLPDVENVMDAPVEGDDEGSIMGVQGLDPAKVLEKLQRVAAERDK